MAIQSSKARGTAISWTKQTWNPTFGCSRVSDGCRACYAETIALKFGHSKLPWTARNAPQNVQLKPHKLREPYSLKEPTKIFVNSMSDLFHPEIPADYLAQVFKVMNDLPQHTFQVLTKRPERAAEWAGPWGPNIWMGTSIENERALPRLDDLRRCGAQVRFVSAEPLLTAYGPGVDLSGIHWVIVGGESGFHMPQHPDRWMPHSWAREIRDTCVDQSVAFFFKQSAGLRTELGTAMQEEDGSLWLWHQYPDDLAAPVPVRLQDSPAYRIPAAPASLPMLA